MHFFLATSSEVTSRPHKVGHRHIFRGYRKVRSSQVAQQDTPPASPKTDSYLCVPRSPDQNQKPGVIVSFFFLVARLWVFSVFGKESLVL